MRNILAVGIVFFSASTMAFAEEQPTAPTFADNSSQFALANSSTIALDALLKENGIIVSQPKDEATNVVTAEMVNKTTLIATSKNTTS